MVTWTPLNVEFIDIDFHNLGELTLLLGPSRVIFRGVKNPLHHSSCISAVLF